MSSPDKTILDFIEIDNKKESAIYIQLVEQIIKGIQLGYLDNGLKLPGTRQLSKILKLNRNTIVKSLEELQAQEWIKIIPNKGTYINAEAQQFKNKITANTTREFAKQTAFTFNKSVLFDLPEIPKIHQIILDDGQADSKLIEYKIPAKNYTGLLKRKINPLLSKEAFEKHFTNYIKLSRNINCKPENLLIANSQEILLYIICKILNTTQLQLAIPGLSHYKSNIIFLSNEVKLEPIPFGKEGYDMVYLENLAKKRMINAIYIPCNYSYPTTITLNYTQRNQLEELGEKYNLILIEHDPYADYYYTAKAITPFLSTNFNQRTLYLSKFGDFLSHNYQFGFMIAPSNIIEEARKHLYLLESTKDELALQVIGEMIKEGEIIRILKKHRKQYKEKRDALCNELYKKFKHEIEIHLPQGGLAIWIEWKKNVNLLQLKNNLETHSIYIPQHCLYQNNEKTGIRIGFASLTLEEIGTIVNQLYDSYSILTNKASN